MDSLSRHEQILRVFHVIDMLFSARKPLSVSEIKDGLRDRGVIDEMSEKNIRRDIEFLEKFGYALQSSKKRTRRGTTCQAWAIEPGRGAKELTLPTITLPELLSLAVARNFFAPLAGTVFWRGISQLLGRIERIATPELLDYVDSHKDGLVVHPKPVQGKYASRTLNAINRAIRGTLELSIRYKSLANDKSKTYLIHPEALVLYDGSIYIAGYPAPAPKKDVPRSGSEEHIRFFKLDRIAEAKPSSRTFERRKQSIESLLADSITIFRSAEPPRRYRVRIDASRARWAQEKPFHPGQTVHQQPDGSVILEIERAWDDEMIPQLLGLAGCAEVLEPEDIRERMLEAAQNIAAKYICRHLREYDYSSYGAS